MNSDILQALYIGVATSITAAVLFLLLMLVLKILVKIKPNISRLTQTIDGKEFDRYFVKIINYSPLRLFEVQLNANYVLETKTLTVGNRKDRKAKLLTLSRNKLPFIEQYRLLKRLFFSKEWGARNCRIIEITEPLEFLLSQENVTLEFSLIARHSLSGFPKVTVKEFTTDNIIRGKFHHGVTGNINRDITTLPFPDKISIDRVRELYEKRQVDMKRYEEAFQNNGQNGQVVEK